MKLFELPAQKLPSGSPLPLASIRQGGQLTWPSLQAALSVASLGLSGEPLCPAGERRQAIPGRRCFLPVASRSQFMQFYPMFCQFLYLGTVDLGARSFFAVGSVLCIVRH